MLYIPGVMMYLFKDKHSCWLCIKFQEAEMINRSTIKALNLKPVTRTKCYDFYVKIHTEFSSPEAIKEAVSLWQENSAKLNSLWWVLNYYSDRLDPDRNLRAYVENYLDRLARKKEPEAPPETKS
jgi:hypothetical protein